MKHRWLTALRIGLLLGSVGGYSLGRFPGPDSSSTNKPPQSDRVIALFDFAAAVAWASEAKWTVEPHGMNPIDPDGFEPEFYPMGSPSPADFSISSLRYLTTNGPPLTVDEQRSFFARFAEHLSYTLGNGGEQPVARSAQLRIPAGGTNIYHYQIEFYPIQSSRKGTTGGVRGTATVWTVGDGEMTMLTLTLTEVSPNSN